MISFYKVSILMPVKNAAPYLIDCLESIQNQTYTNWEVIAIEDFSEDSSERILGEYAKRDPRIKIFKNIGRGIVPALQYAYSLSCGEWITRMDADDIMHFDKLEKMTTQLTLAGLSHIAIGKVKYFSTVKELGEGYKKYELWLNGLTETGTNFTEIYKECVIPSPCWMLHRKDLDSIGGMSSLEYPEDYDLCFKMYAGALKVLPSNEILHFWRDHPERSSRNLKEYADNRFLDLKIKYFAQMEISDSTLFLWGAGKKGKYIAKELINRGVEFLWISNNPNKIGKSIYGTIVHGEEKIMGIGKGNVVLAIAGKDTPKEMLEKIKQFTVFPFC
jgi:glycosyltransferase involved in cell wall biosynthesis